MVYLNLLRQNTKPHSVSLIGYCLMSNRVHMVVVPHKADGLSSIRKRSSVCSGLNLVRETQLTPP